MSRLRTQLTFKSSLEVMMLRVEDMCHCFHSVWYCKETQASKKLIQNQQLNDTAIKMTEFHTLSSFKTSLCNKRQLKMFNQFNMCQVLSGEMKLTLYNNDLRIFCKELHSLLKIEISLYVICFMLSKEADKQEKKLKRTS